MLCWVFVFLGTAIIASLRGLGGVASTAAGIAQVLFFVFLIVFLGAMVMGSVRHRPAGRAPNGDPEDGAGPQAVGDSSIAGRTPRAATDDPGRTRPRHAA
jgi:uncharacterized membrane protein YtjA (UPF0391 family)